MFDPQRYRSREEIEAWQQRCPIATLGARLQAQGALDAGALAQLEAEVAEEIAAAVEFAEAAEWEPVEDLQRHVYTEPGTP